jgi:hypothetical protein
MAKFGYICKCGWRLTRGLKTRKQYARAKREHAAGDEFAGFPPCKFLADELARTPRVRN